MHLGVIAKRFVSLTHLPIVDIQKMIFSSRFSYAISQMSLSFYIHRLLGLRVTHDDWVMNRAFPLGQTDIDAVTNALISYLEKSTIRSLAERIAVDLGVLLYSENGRFTETTLRTVLFWNGLYTISEERVKLILDYAMLLNEAYRIGKYPSEMVKIRDGWLHPKYSGFIKPQS
jgi:hypothetical protein